LRKWARKIQYCCPQVVLNNWNMSLLGRIEAIAVGRHLPVLRPSHHMHPMHFFRSSNKEESMHDITFSYNEDEGQRERAAALRENEEKARRLAEGVRKRARKRRELEAKVQRRVRNVLELPAKGVAARPVAVVDDSDDDEDMRRDT
jgi:hypothetical protein